MIKKCHLVTITQALLLRELGFDEPCTYYCWNCKNIKYAKMYINEGIPTQWNKFAKIHHYAYLSIPTVDEAIDWLRRKFHLMIVDSIMPFVDPKAGKIVYIIAVKKCYIKGGWNYREFIGRTKHGYNRYAAKRSGITIALKWLKSKKTKIIKLNSHETRKYSAKKD